MAKELTEKQSLFLEALFSKGVDGDPVKAKAKAGYSPATPLKEIMNSLKEEILEATRDYIASRAPKAALKMEGIMDNPSQFGASTGLSAAKEILDRSGVLKPEKATTGEVIGVLLLPPKEE